MGKALENASAPFDSKLFRVANWQHIAVPIAGALMLVFWLRWLGRPWACQSNALCLWGASSTENSLRLIDAYSLLHLSFGILVFAALYALTTKGRRSESAIWCFALITFLSWEAIENVPEVIAMFNSPEGMASYTGDSILNAAGDVQCGAMGFFVAQKCRTQTATVLVILCDAATTILVADGLVLGTLRLLQFL